MFVQRAKRGGGGRGVCTARDPPARLTRSIFNFASFAGDRSITSSWRFYHRLPTLTRDDQWLRLRWSVKRRRWFVDRGGGGGGCEGWIEWRTRHESISFDPSSTDKPVNRGSMRANPPRREAKNKNGRRGGNVNIHRDVSSIFHVYTILCSVTFSIYFQNCSTIYVKNICVREPFFRIRSFGSL